MVVPHNQQALRLLPEHVDESLLQMPPGVPTVLCPVQIERATECGPFNLNGSTKIGLQRVYVKRLIEFLVELVKVSYSVFDQRRQVSRITRVHYGVNVI